MSDTNNNATVTTQDNNSDNRGERTFTQTELDAIVRDRLARERGKFADYEELKAKAAKFDEAEENNKTELQKATEKAAELQNRLDEIEAANTLNAIRASVAEKLGVPASLLTGTDEDTCTAQATSILEFAKKTSYPNIKDGGEGTPPALTKADILAIKSDSERLKAIKEHIDLF